MRWDRFFDDLEDQVASEWEAERVALESEAERLRLSRVTLRERLTVLAEPEGGAVVIDFVDGAMLRLVVNAVGTDWVGLVLEDGAPGAVIAPLSAVAAIGMPHADILRSARPARARTSVAERMPLGYLLRDLARRRLAVTIHLVHGGTLSGTIDRAGADHLDLALHEPGSPRRATEVRGHRVVPFTAIARVRVDVALR